MLGHCRRSRASSLALRGSVIALPAEDLVVTGDRRAVERLLARLMATLVSASGLGERIGVQLALESDDKVAITIDRPRRSPTIPAIRCSASTTSARTPTLLGTGFALRLHAISLASSAVRS
jgi:hypothetical protein